MLKLPGIRFTQVVLSLLALCVATSCDVRAQQPNEAAAAAAAKEGSNHYERGDFQSAIAPWQRAAALYTSQPKRRMEILLDLAAAYQRLGLHRLASEAVSEVLGSEESGRLRSLAENLRGTFAVSRQEYAAALNAFKEALALAKQAGDDALAAMVLNNLANALSLSGNHRFALERYAESALMAEALDDAILAGRARVNGLRSALELEDWPEASKLASRAETGLLGLAPSGEQAILLLSLGRSHTRWKDPTGDPYHSLKARMLLLRAYETAEAVGDHRSVTYALGYLGELYERDGQHREALGLFQRALASAQSAEAPEALYLWKWGCARAYATLHDRPRAIASYRDAIDTLEPVRRDLSLGPPSSGPRRPVTELFSELSDLLLREAAERAEPAEAQTLLREVRDVRESLKSVQLEDYFQDECVHIALSSARPVDSLAEDTAVVYIVPLSDRTELLLSLPRGRMERFPIPVKEDQLTSAVRDFRNLVEKRVTYEFLEPARRLHDWLIAPMQSTLQSNGVRTIVFVPDGLLGTIPMSALFDGNRFLVERFAIAVAPGLHLLGPRPFQRTARNVLLAGLSEGAQGFPRLSNVAHELAEAEALLGGTLLMNDAFRNDSLEEAFARNSFSIVHIASHGQFDGDVRRTFLLTHDGRLTLDQLERLIKPSQFRGRPVELLTLSACQTATGDERAALGLAGVALKAGARSALATLWSVDDEATSILISHFYRNLLSGDASLSKAGALQAAQQSLLRDPRYDHPAYWSPYLIIGNWL